MAYPNDDSSPAASPALTAFLHGIEGRAWVFALSQSGDAKQADTGLELALLDFAMRARSLPLAQWPIQFWTSLLKQPTMLAEIDPDLDLARFSAGPRAALLLRLIAGLDFAHAAQVLGVSPAAYEVALNHALAHPDLDDAWMQELREQLHQLIQQLPAERRQALAALRHRALSTLPEPARPGQPPPAVTTHRRWWWAALGLLLLALFATFVWPLRSRLAPGQSEALPIEAVSAPPRLSDTVIVTHPDYQQLAQPADDALADQLAFLSWLAASQTQPPGITATPVGAVPPAPTSWSQLGPEQQVLLSSARSTWSALGPTIRAALIDNARDWLSKSPQQRGQLSQRLRQWDRQNAAARARRRTPYMAWQGLSAGDRQRVRVAQAGLAMLKPADQQSVRVQFSALPADSQRLWWLGPALGQELMPMASLFSFIPEAERPALLLALRGLDAQTRSDLAVLAPRLNEAQRQGLRRGLLAAPADKRAALIHGRLAQ